MKCELRFPRRILPCLALAVALFPGSTRLDAQLAWLERDSGSTNELSAVTAAAGVWIATGDQGTILSSPDRLVWTPRLTNPTLSFEGAGHSPDRFVAVGRAGAIWTSENGVDWDPAESTVSDWLSAVTWENGRFVAVGDQGTVLTSPTGTNWTAQPPATDRFLSAVTAQGSLLVAVGFRGAIVTSTDGTNWIARVWDAEAAADSWLRGVTYGNGRFVAVGFKELSNPAGHSGLILTSTNAVDWTVRSIEFEQPLDAVAFDGSRFVAVGDSGIILTSVDGAGWTESNPPQGKYLRGVAANQDGLVAVGTRGTILVSTEQAVGDRLVLSQPRLDADGFFSFFIEGAAPGQWMRVQASSDLATWAVIDRLQGASGPVRYSDPDPATEPRRFYRVLSP